MDRSDQGLFLPRSELKTKGEKESRSPFVFIAGTYPSKNKVGDGSFILYKYKLKK
ncbi:hypothetical protein [Bacillus pseudomycoides]|uniref:hypothetical protein n=1 Tax=Bacillus pseudomycoides TaxID=64104 RepID=UPI001780EFB9|nr:hypothetical protein [Bacillus pseudomycoides]MED1622881.1 hypothetical protein [Bacillus pseudomycoides]